MVPDPDNHDVERGFEGRLEAFDHAVLLPVDKEHGIKRQVVHPGSHQVIYFVESDCRAPLDPAAAAAHAEPRSERLGTYLFGGFVRVHFGHFIVECMAPLWALDHIDEAIDGILFLPFHDPSPQDPPHVINRLNRTVRQWLAGFGVHENIEIVREPTRVEKLYVSENGMGFYEKFRGSSYFQKFMRTRNADSSAADRTTNRRKLFLTRTGLSIKKGQVIGEAALERSFAAAGYEIYAPEQHSLGAQLDAYRTASHIVGVEGSALHVPPITCASDCRVAVISRRWSREKLHQSFGQQFEGFAGVTPVLINTCTAFWGLPGLKEADYRSLAVIDFARTYETLIETGFLSGSTPLFEPSLEEMTLQIVEASKAYKTHMTIVGLDPKDS